MIMLLTAYLRTKDDAKAAPLTFLWSL